MLTVTARGRAASRFVLRFFLGILPSASNAPPLLLFLRFHFEQIPRGRLAIFFGGRRHIRDLAQSAPTHTVEAHPRLLLLDDDDLTEIRVILMVNVDFEAALPLAGGRADAADDV